MSKILRNLPPRIRHSDATAPAAGARWPCDSLDRPRSPLDARASPDPREVAPRRSPASRPEDPALPSLPRPAEFESRAARTRLVAVAVAALIGLAIASPAGAGAPGPEASAEPRPAEPPADPVAAVPDTPALSHARPAPPTPEARPPRPVLDPSARLLRDDDASEAWTLFLELESGHRITQRFLLTNVGPGSHSAVAVGHLVEPGRAPYRYENGRRRSRWTLSDDRLFFDIAASHLDLHRPTGELRITKDDIELRFFFEFARSQAASAVPPERTPPGMHIEVLAIGVPTHGTIRAPWMTAPLATRGHAWLVHGWSEREEADVLSRRLEVFGRTEQTSFYAVHLEGRGDWQSAWRIEAGPRDRIVESEINVPEAWIERMPPERLAASRRYPVPERLEVRAGHRSGAITLDREWLRFDPLEVIPQPFRWFIRRRSEPQEVWAEARIGGSLLLAPDSPSLPPSGEMQPASAGTNASSEARGSRETERETAIGSVAGVASITFLNPVKRR